MGRRGNGVGHKARQDRPNRLVALKMILPDVPVSDADLARFRAESEALARLPHPNIVQIYEVGEYNGKPFFSLEYVDGGSLWRNLRGTPMPPALAADLVRTLAEAVQYAHRNGIVHRDLKPGNVLLTAAGTPKITDFGIAKFIEQTHGPTQTGTLLGTCDYMPPEQAEGRRNDIGPASDIYALGAILYETLTGRPPFKTNTAAETLRLVIHVPPVPPRALRPEVPRDLEAICLKCLEKQPGGRYDTALALAQDLGCYQRGEPTHARPLGWLGHSWYWCRRKPATAGLAAALVLVILAGVIAFEFVPRQTTTVPTVAPLGLELTLKAVKQGKDELWPLDGPNVLPLRAGDALRIEAHTARPAYFYVLNLTAEGKVALLYPWRNDEQWESITEEKRRDFYCIPDPKENADASKLGDGPSGVESVVVLARETPLTATERAQLRKLLRTWPVDQGKFDALRAAVNIGEDEFRFGDARDEKERGKVKPGDTVEVSDPVLLLRRLLQGDVRTLGVASRGVCYTFQGKWSLPVLGASTVGLLSSPFGQGPILAVSALDPGRIDK